MVDHAQLQERIESNQGLLVPCDGRHEFWVLPILLDQLADPGRDGRVVGGQGGTTDEILSGARRRMGFESGIRADHGLARISDRVPAVGQRFYRVLAS